METVNLCPGCVVLCDYFVSEVIVVTKLSCGCSVIQEARKQRSGRSLTEESRDEHADKKRGIFFSWSRNRSFGKGPKKKDIGEINLGEQLSVSLHIIYMQYMFWSLSLTSKLCGIHYVVFVSDSRMHCTCCK